MRIRTLIASTLVAVSLFASSTAVFAQVGTGDTWINAVSVKQDPIYDGWVTSGIVTEFGEYDWYSWTNTDTTLNAHITVFLYMPYKDYRLGVPSNPSKPDGLFNGYVTYDQLRKTAFQNIIAEPGQTVYWRVSRTSERPTETRNYFTYARLNFKF